MLQTINPREQNGRDTISRFKAQLKSAAMASLSILEGKEADRVYCDLHDDFVIRLKEKNRNRYIFYQVKTKSKANHNWSLNEVFGLLKNQTKQTSDKIKDSFVGKLLLHTIVFDEYCNSVVFQTNIHSDDNIDALIDDIKTGEFENKFTKVLIDKFNTIFSDEIEIDLTSDEIKSKLVKLDFETDVQYLKNDDEDFEALARSAIYKFSEVELNHAESKEILMKLLELVERKSSGVIKELTEDSIEQLAGISIEDLLSILSISNTAYQSLLVSGDQKAVKSASIIQRTLKEAGASEQQIEYCSRCKTDWDLWYRKNRHIIGEPDLIHIVGKIRQLFISSKDTQSSINISDLRNPVKDLKQALKDDDALYDLELNHLLGGVFSELVRGE